MMDQTPAFKSPLFNSHTTVVRVGDYGSSLNSSLLSTQQCDFYLEDYLIRNANEDLKPNNHHCPFVKALEHMYSNMNLAY